MKHIAAIVRQDQLAGQILVLRVRFDQLVRVHRIEDGLTGNVPSLQTHVDMIGPKNLSFSDACLNKS